MAYKMTNLKKKTEEIVLDKIFDEYITNCKLRGLSETTIKEYEKFYRYYVKPTITYPKDLNKSFSDKLILGLKEKQYNPTSINTIIIRLKAFANWMFTNGYIKKLEISKLKEEENIKEPYTQEELKILLKKPNLKACGFKEYRTWVIICTALSTGLRRTSMANLTLEDIDFESNLIYVKVTKNKKRQVLPLSTSLKSIFIEYLKFRNNITEVNNYLFIDCYGKQLKLVEFSNNVQDYCVARGVNKSGLHRLRNTFAINYLENGGNLFHLQELLNHKNISVTRKYVYLTTQHLQEDFDKLNPLNNILSSRKAKLR